jgi:hypothetical protein
MYDPGQICTLECTVDQMSASMSTADPVIKTSATKLFVTA